MSERPVFIGIAGGTASGKTSITRRLRAAFGPEGTGLLEQDAYYRPLGHLSMAERAAHNFDHPGAIDWELLKSHLEELISGRPIERPVYDFQIHDRGSRTIRVAPNPVIFIEGILIFWPEWLRSLLDVKVFIETPADLRLARRIRRDTLERARSLDTVLEQYEQRVRPMHEKFVEPTKAHADVIIPRGAANEVGIDMVKSLVNGHLNAQARTHSEERR